MMANKWILFGFILAGFIPLSPSVGAGAGVGPSFQKPNMSHETETYLTADSIVRDTAKNHITATGHVLAERDGHVLKADTLVYDETNKKIHAVGHVELHDPRGNILFFDTAELTDDLKNGIIQRIKMLMIDDGRLVATTGVRADGVMSRLEKTVYSPCYLCQEKPGAAPLWQLTANHTVWDEQKEDVYYTDAFLEMFGVPVVYMPYFRHPAPTVKRRSGLLAPFYGYNSTIGAVVGAPYFWAFADDKDMTATPMIMGNNWPMLQLEYRQRFERGFLKTEGSITQGPTEKNRLTGKEGSYSGRERWHVFSDAKYDLTPKTRAGIHVERVSDQTFLRHYPFFGHQNTAILTSDVYGETFQGRSYGSAKSYVFQGLREGDSVTKTPFILPVLNYNYVGSPDRWGGRLRMDGNVLSLHRRQGADMNRISVTGGWDKDVTSSYGDIWTYGGNLRTDGYAVSGYGQDPLKPRQKNSTHFARIHPETYGRWRFPFVRPSNKMQVLIEPVAGVTVSPNTGHPNKLAIEDNRFLEFDDTSLFSNNRFAGLDRIDSGSRAQYGLHFASASKQFGQGDVFLGQNFSFVVPRAYLRGTGLDNRSSDYVGRISYGWSDWVRVRGRALFARSSLMTPKAETSLILGRPIFQLDQGYSQLTALPGDASDRPTEQIYTSVSSQFTERWKVHSSMSRQLGSRGGALSQELGLTYHDECFTFRTTLSKNFYQDRDLKPGTAILFQIVFKNLGEFSHSLGGALNPFDRNSEN